MATKGQKFKKYSPELKKMIVEEFQKTQVSLYALCQKYNVSSPETIMRWIQGYEREGMDAFREKRGSAKKESSPFKGRPKRIFKNEEEEKAYTATREAYYKQKALDKEHKNMGKNKIN